jgi:hypothetical protein
MTQAQAALRAATFNARAAIGAGNASRHLAVHASMQIQ